MSIRLRSPRGSDVKSACINRLFFLGVVRSIASAAGGYGNDVRLRMQISNPRFHRDAATVLGGGHFSRNRKTNCDDRHQRHNRNLRFRELISYTLASSLIPVRKHSERRSRPSVIWTSPRRHVGQNNDTPFACQIESRQLHPAIAGDDLFVEEGLNRQL